MKTIHAPVVVLTIAADPPLEKKNFV